MREIPEDDDSPGIKSQEWVGGCCDLVNIDVADKPKVPTFRLVSIP